MTMTLDGTAGITFPSGSGTQAAQSKVLQVVNATSNVSTSTTSTSYVATSLTASITPLFSTSKIFMVVTASTGSSTTNVIYSTIYRNSSTNLAGGTSCLSESGNNGGYSNNCSMSFLDSPATTSSTTYTAYIRVNNSTGYWGDSTFEIANITLMEIAA